MNVTKTAKLSTDDKKLLLDSYRELDDYINQLVDDRAHWSDMLLHCRAANDIRVRHDLEVEPVDETVDKIVSLERQIDNSINLLVDFRTTILDEMEKLNSIKLKRIMHMKYLKGMTFEQIAEHTGYCTRQIVRLHNNAINLLFVKDNPFVKNMICYL